MCIRDRCAQKWVDLSEGDYGAALLNDSKYGHDIRDNVIRPVSYTHLRAHETVLDLVCRLLLDKKNNYTTNRHRCDDNIK